MCYAPDSYSALIHCGFLAFLHVHVLYGIKWEKWKAYKDGFLES